MNSRSGSFCYGKFLLVAILPTIFILLLIINYFNILNFINISGYTFYIVLIIYIIFLFFIPHNAFLASCKVKKQLNVTRTELEKSLENSAVTIDGKSKSVSNVRDFLDEYFKNIRNDNFAKIASSTFPMLGILGTFIAIAVSMPDFTINSSKELDNQISILLSGVGTAFYASIFGIFLSLLWTFFDRYGLSEVDKLTNSLEDIYSNYIWSEKELLKFKYDQNKLFENEFTNHLKDIFNLDFIKEVNREHLSTYEKIIDKTQDGLKSIEKSLIISSNQLKSTIDKLNMNEESVEATNQLKANIKEFNHSAKELKNLLESFDSGLDDALKRVDSELAKSVEHIESMARSVKEI